ncbi:hypothetical protein AKO1_013937 [Acrasis kona]|uniref:Uncharacterized protein n=1 Tax=Acrasis kona TaxID=1008807 RepID=A0AAW2Z313_9EUKA
MNGTRHDDLLVDSIQDDSLHTLKPKHEWRREVSIEQKKQMMTVVLTNFKVQPAFFGWHDIHIFHYTSRALLQFWDESRSKEEFLEKVSNFSDSRKTPPPHIREILQYPMFVAAKEASRPRVQQNVEINSTCSQADQNRVCLYWDKLNTLQHLKHHISPYLTFLERQCRELEQMNCELPLSDETIRLHQTKIQASIALGSYLIRLHKEMSLTSEQINELNRNSPPTEKDYENLTSVEKLLKSRDTVHLNNQPNL